MKFKNHYNTQRPKGETNYLPSCTVPDETMSLKELLVRAMRGIEVPTKAPIYMGEHYDMPNPYAMDLVDRQNMKEMAEAELKEFQEKLFPKKEDPKKTASPQGGTGGGDKTQQQQQQNNTPVSPNQQQQTNTEKQG